MKQHHGWRWTAETGRTRSVSEFPVAPAEEEQRFGLASLGLLDLADIDSVIAAIVRGGHLAFDVTYAAGQDRRTVGADVVANAIELLAAAHGELAREVLLVRCQDVDGERPGLVKACVAFGLLVDANQEQRRHQRDRGKCVRGESMHLAGLSKRRDDRNAGREMTHHTAQFIFLNRHRLNLRAWMLTKRFVAGQFNPYT